VRIAVSEYRSGIHTVKPLSDLEQHMNDVLDPHDRDPLAQDMNRLD
jgi:hypothetical protein